MLNKVRVGNTVIYEISDKISPPGPLRPTADEGLSLFRSFHHLVSTGLDQRILFDENAVTVLFPVDDAWKSLGLTEKYLLSPSAGDALQKILLYGILKGVHYSHEFPSKAKLFQTLNGDSITLLSDGKNLIIDNLGLNLSMAERDILSSNGVAHSISAVPIPLTITVTPENLINAAGATKWQAILQEHSMTEYLDLNSNYTLLIPTDEALDSLPWPTMSPETIKSLITLHIIPPTNGRPPDLLTNKPKLYSTLGGITISIHKIYADRWSISANSSSVSHILDQGRTTNGAQILLIDQVLLAPEVSKWTLITLVSIAIFGLAVCVTAIFGSRWVLGWWQNRREEDLFVDRGDEESEPFLNGTS